MLHLSAGERQRHLQLWRRRMGGRPEPPDAGPPSKHAPRPRMDDKEVQVVGAQGAQGAEGAGATSGAVVDAEAPAPEAKESLVAARVQAAEMHVALEASSRQASSRQQEIAMMPRPPLLRAWVAASDGDDASGRGSSNRHDVEARNDLSLSTAVQAAVTEVATTAVTAAATTAATTVAGEGAAASAAVDGARALVAQVSQGWVGAVEAEAEAVLEAEAVEAAERPTTETTCGPSDESWSQGDGLMLAKVRRQRQRAVDRCVDRPQAPQVAASTPPPPPAAAATLCVNRPDDAAAREPKSQPLPLGSHPQRDPRSRAASDLEGGLASAATSACPLPGALLPSDEHDDTCSRYNSGGKAARVLGLGGGQAVVAAMHDAITHLPTSPLPAAPPSFAHELSEDPSAIGFALGELHPGTIHARGRVHAEHTLHYSIGRAGTYRLYVGLRHESALLPGCPYSLRVLPGIPSAHHTYVELPEATALVSVAGCRSRAVRVIACDMMGNRCTDSGGACVTASCTIGHVVTRVVDNHDGSYTFGWLATLSGRHKLRVCLNGHEILHSPVPLRVTSSRPDVQMFDVSGEGRHVAVAGDASRVYIRCFDAFGNRLRPPHSRPLSQSGILFGLAIVDPGGANQPPGANGGGGGGGVNGGGGGGSSVSTGTGGGAAAASGGGERSLSPQCTSIVASSQTSAIANVTPGSPSPSRASTSPFSPSSLPVQPLAPHPRRCGVYGTKDGFDSIGESMSFEGSWLEADAIDMRYFPECAGHF